MQWQSGGLTISSGLAVQPEGVGSLTGSRSFRAPASVSASLTLAYGRELRPGLSSHLQADHWRTLATQGRSLWQADFSMLSVGQFPSSPIALPASHMTKIGPV